MSENETNHAQDLAEQLRKAADAGDELTLSPTDLELCADALREFLADRRAA